jgi:hypothetical protein
MAGKKKNPGLEGLTKIITNIQSGKTGISTVDKQKKSDAVLLSQLKSRAKRNKVSVKPETFDITPKAGSAFDINKKTIMKAKFGGEAMKLTPKQEKLDKNKDGKISGDDFAKMEMGGKVEKYGHGGSVKGSGMSCRGMGEAIKGGGFKIR